MSELQLAVSHAVKVGLVVVLAGLVVRGRAGACWSFAAYAAATLVGNCLSTLLPEAFFTAAFWILKQGIYDVLKILIALELAWRAFEAFPGARRTASLVLLVLLSVGALVLGVLTPTSTYDTLWKWQPGVVVAALWLLTGTALLVVWFQVPVLDWQRAIMLGLAPYMLTFVVVLDLLRVRGFEPARPMVGLLDSLAFLAIVVFWAFAVWRPREVARV